MHGQLTGSTTRVILCGEQTAANLAKLCQPVEQLSKV